MLIEDEIDVEEVRSVINRRIVSPPSSRKYLWPKVVQDQEPHWAHYYENGRFLLYFLDYNLLRIQNQFQNTKYGPLPGLFTTSDKDRCMTRLEGSTNIFLRSNYCPEMYLLNLGQDCTITVQEHPIQLTIPSYGQLSYQIPLAYIITTGQTIAPFDVCQKLDELVAYSIKSWSGNGY